jgi:ankyrin repeat protein
MVVGLFLHASQGDRILQRILQEGNDDLSSWEHNGPTSEDIKKATQIKNLAAKGSLEEKLINAVKCGDLKDVEISIAQGVNLEARDNSDMTALMIAADRGYSDIVKILIYVGADVNAKNKFNWTALFWAVQNKHAEIVKNLIVKGDATDKQYFKDFLLSAVHRGDTQMVKSLMLGSDRLENDAFDDAYSTALMHRRSKPELYNIIAEAYNNRK